MPLPEVRYSFECDAGGETPWRVVRFNMTETLALPYECVIELANEDVGADADTLLGGSSRLTIDRDGHTRHVCGLVRRVERLGSTAGHRLARVHVVPALWALSQRRNCRIFQDVSVPQIVTTILSESLRSFDRDFDNRLQAQYPTREYVVQYNESDLDFVLRLTQDEGISFYFEQGEKERIVLVDRNTAFPSAATMASPVEIRGPEVATADVESIRHFDVAASMMSTSSTVRDFDWTQPSRVLATSAQGRDGSNREREVFEYPGPLAITGYDAGQNKYTADDGRAKTTARREAFESRRRVAQSESNVIALAAGFTVEVSGAANASDEGRYLVTRVTHTGEAPEELTNETSSDARRVARYENRIECIPADVPFRPERTLSPPVISGTQTATVVGPASEEIHTEHHGRVKVQFHWDREGRRDDRSSCWVRVAQVWAGAGWGFQFLPRVGMEVVVAFLDGNPDRPLVIGCVYNGEHGVPYPLPDDKPISAIRTQSTPGGGGHNELSFNDEAGSEEVHLRAERNLREIVRHDHSTRVGNNQTNAVRANQTESVGGDQSLSVSGARSKTVSKDEQTHVHQNRTETVDGDERVTIHGSRTSAVDHDAHESVGGARSVQVTGNDSEAIGGARATTVTHDDSLTVSGNLGISVSHQATLSATDKIQATQGSSTLSFESNHVALDGGTFVRLHSPAGTIEIGVDGGTIRLNAGQRIRIEAGSATVTLASDGTITLAGARLALN